MASPFALPDWTVFGSKGVAYLDESESAWKIQYVKNLDEGVLREELAAPGRSYLSGETIDWREKIVPFSDIEAIDYYDKCHEYYTRAAAPFVPIEQTRDIMRLLEACRVSNAEGAPEI